MQLSLNPKAPGRSQKMDIPAQEKTGREFYLPPAAHTGEADPIYCPQIRMLISSRHTLTDLAQTCRFPNTLGVPQPRPGDTENYRHSRGPSEAAPATASASTTCISAPHVGLGEGRGHRALGSGLPLISWPCRPSPSTWMGGRGHAPVSPPGVSSDGRKQPFAR